MFKVLKKSHVLSVYLLIYLSRPQTHSFTPEESWRPQGNWKKTAKEGRKDEGREKRREGGGRCGREGGG